MFHILKLNVMLGSLILLVLSGSITDLVYAQTKSKDGSLYFKTIGSPEKAFFVLSTIIYGKTESILFDGTYKLSDGKRVAAEIEKTGTKLKAIILSHADHDHYMGAMEILKKFPGTPIYTTETILDDFKSRAQSDLDRERKGKDPTEVPNELIKPQLLPNNPIMVDGEIIEIVANLAGDVKGPSSLALWVPSAKTILTGDLVFDGLHPWLGYSDIASRKHWRESLELLASFKPKHVIPGHKVQLSSPDGPKLINFMIDYLKYYDQSMSESKTPEEVIAKVKSQYPNLALEILMIYGTKMWFKK